MGNVIMCGPKGRVTAESISNAERKTIRNFQKFLMGKGTRCPYCLHKAKKHHGMPELQCFGRGCDCIVSAAWIKRWWAKRLEKGSPTHTRKSTSS
jgi:hypothetical protein